MKIKIYIFVVGLLITAHQLTAQVSVEVQHLPGGLVQRENLWNIVLVNNSKDVAEVTLQLEVKSITSGQVLLTGTAPRLSLEPGVKVVNAAMIQPIVYNFSDPAFSENFLPFGDYLICYRVNYLSAAEEQQSTIECTNVQIDPLAPPLLSSPLNEDTLENPYPQFAWIPPAPASMLQHINYALVLVKVNRGQQPVEAVRNNLPVYSNYSLQHTFGYYPSAYPALDTGIVYAWQVRAFNSKGYNGRSEIWTFTVHDKRILPTIQSASYIHIQENKGINTIGSLVLYIKCHSFESEQKVSAIFQNMEGAVLLQEQRVMKPGNNYFRFNLNKNFKKNTVYKLKMKEQDGTEYTLRFTIQ